MPELDVELGSATRGKDNCLLHQPGIELVRLKYLLIKIRLISTSGSFPGVSVVKNLPKMQETQDMWVWSLVWEYTLAKEMATHSSILAWEIPWMEEPGGIQSMRLQELDTT